MYYLAKQTPWGVAGLGRGLGTDMTEDQWRQYIAYGANQLTYYVNTAGGLDLPMDGQITAEKIAALFRIIESNLPAGKTLATATPDEIGAAWGFADPDLLIVLQGILEEVLADEQLVAYAQHMASNMSWMPGVPQAEKKRPWWHWALIIGTSALAGAILDQVLVGYVEGRWR